MRVVPATGYLRPATGESSRAAARPAAPTRAGGRQPAAGSRDLRVELSRAVRGWAPARADIATWASAALGRKARGRELAVRLVAPRESRTLNAHYRHRDEPTNVLSFPAGTSAHVSPRPLGDLVICPAVLRGEARAQGKSVRAHWAHLVVHGALHLAGYDHERPNDAQRMERREIAVLRRLGFANPYLSDS